MSTEDKSKTMEVFPDPKVGPLGDAVDFAESLYAGFVYCAAIKELMRAQLEVNAALEMADELPAEILAEVKATDAEMEDKWLLAMGMLGIEA